MSLYQAGYFMVIMHDYASALREECRSWLRIKTEAVIHTMFNFNNGKPVILIKKIKWLYYLQETTCLLKSRLIWTRASFVLRKAFQKSLNRMRMSVEFIKFKQALIPQFV